jgi:hypothetical protein
MRKFWTLVIVLLIIGNLSWGADLTLKAGKITNLPYKADFVGGVSFDFSLAPSVKFLKNLRGDIGFLIANPDWQPWQNMTLVRTNQVLLDIGALYQFSFKVEKIKLQPCFGAGFSYLMASLDWQDTSYSYGYSYYDDYYRQRYAFERKNCFNFYLNAGLKIFLSKKIFVKPEIKVYQADDETMTALLIGIGYRLEFNKKSRP